MGASRSMRLGGALDLVAVAEQHHGRVIVARLLGRDPAIGDDDDFVTRLHQPRGGAVSPKYRANREPPRWHRW